MDWKNHQQSDSLEVPDREPAEPSLEGRLEFCKRESEVPPRSAAARPVAPAFPAAPEAAMQDSYNVLFLCTGNSARSIFAEAILNRRGASRFHAYSAGSYPKGVLHPIARRQLAEAGLSTESLRSKSWDEFAKPGSPQMHFIFTVCDSAAKEVCPIWPGHPITGHWSVPDPAAAKGTAEEIERAFREAFFILERHFDLFLCLPHGSLDAIGMKAKVAELNRT